MASEGSVMAVIRASRPSFRNAHDKIAFALHSTFLAAGFCLTAIGAAADDNPPNDGEVGIEGWNEQEDSYAFLYSKKEKGAKKTVLVKCLAVGDNLMIDVLNLEDQKKEPFHVEINVKEYVNDGGDEQISNYGEVYKNFSGLVKTLNEGILTKLEPKVQSSTSSSRFVAERSRHRPTNEPAAGYPVEPQPYLPGLVYPPVPPVGGSDLFPGPGAGFYPDRGFGSGGSMLLGPNDPRWFGGVGPGPGFPGGVPGVPPGARFDPYGPPDVPGFEPGRFVRNPRRPGGGTHPDLEHFQGPDYI